MKFVFFVILFGCSSLLVSQEQTNIDLKQVDMEISLDTVSKQIVGRAKYTIQILEKSDSLFLNAVDMHFKSVRINKRKASFRENGNKIYLYKRFKKGREITVEIDYVVQPKKAVYFVGWDGVNKDSQIWTQGQGKNNSHWVPSLDDMNDKAVFNLNIRFYESFTVVANGKLAKTENIDGAKFWQFVMEKPMSSYLLAFAIGNYSSKEIQSSDGIPLSLFYYPKDSSKVEPTYRHSKEIFDFLVHEIGTPYPWQVYKQIPVRDFLYAGMENTTATIFSDTYVVDSVAFVDKNYVNVNAHELAHQWFGNLVTEKDGEHHWLHEGFATYYALLAEKEIFGADYFYWKLFDTANQLHSLSLNNKGEALNDPRASSLTFYEKGAWALLALTHKVGKGVFKSGVKTFLHRYGYKTVRISDFLGTMEEAAQVKLDNFEDTWIQDKVFPFEEAMSLLKENSEEIKNYLDLEKILIAHKENNQIIIEKWWSTASETLRTRVVMKYYKSLDNSFLSQAFESTNIHLRQALSTSRERITEDLRLPFESLLRDKSYITQENALYRLWISFPEWRSTYLEWTKDSFGLPNYSLRHLWLTLALLTKDYCSPSQYKSFADELFGYTSSTYSYEIRQNAFVMILSVFPLRDKNLVDLIKATNHHYWRFRDFSRDLLNELLETDSEKKRILKIAEELHEQDLRYIRTKVNLP